MFYPLVKFGAFDSQSATGEHDEHLWPNTLCANGVESLYEKETRKKRQVKRSQVVRVSSNSTSPPTFTERALTLYRLQDQSSEPCVQNVDPFQLRNCGERKAPPVFMFTVIHRKLLSYFFWKSERPKVRFEPAMVRLVRTKVKGGKISAKCRNVDGDLAESIKRSASDRLGDLVP